MNRRLSGVARRPFLLPLLASAAILALATACGGGEPSAAAPTPPPPAVVPALTGLTASTTALALTTGQTGALTITATLAAGATPTFALVSSNTSVATIAGGAGQYAITAVGPGTATLAATVSASGTGLTTATRTLEIPVTVSAPVVVTLTPSALALRPGGSGVLTIAITGGTPVPAPQSCTSSSVAVATAVLSGATCVVTAVGPGNATITATAASGQSAQATVSVAAEPAIASLTITPDVSALAVGQQVTLVPAVTRASAAVSVTYDYRSANSAVASVNASGTVTAVSAGTSEITVTARGSGGGFVATELTGTARVTVTPGSPTVTIDPGSITLPRGLARQATAVVRNAAGTIVSGETVRWTSSDTSIARVDATGLIVSGRPGNAVIEASSGDVRGAAAVTVTAPPSNAACRLPTRTGSVSFGFPRQPARLRTTGTVRATVLFVDFVDAPATRTPQSVLNIIQPTAGAFFTAQSYGAMTLVLDPQLRWLRMAKPSTQYGWPNAVTFEAHRQLLQEAADLAAPFTDMTATDLLVVMTNPDAGAITFGPAFVPFVGGGIRVPGRVTTIDNATNSGRDLTGWGGLWLAHEMGHLMSLPDLYDYGPPTPSQTHRHVGEWSLMGLISGRGAEFSAFERWQLGWLADEQLVCVPAATSLVALTPITQPGGTKAAIVPLSATSALVIESRRALGFDARIPQAGALAYVIDTQVASGRGTMRVLPADDADGMKLTRVLGPGQSVTVGGASITLVSRADGVDVVRVVRP